MSEFKTDKIKPVDAGSTTTLGESGDTIATGTGTTLDIQGTYSGINAISWDTTAKTANFTAETNKGYFIDTSSGGVTVTLPATPVAGSFIGIKDYALTAQTNNITIAPNGNKIQGSTNNFLINTQGGSANLVYVDSTQGWLTFDAAQASDIEEGPVYITATGGTVTTCGNDKIHTFTGPGTFTVCSVGNPAGSDTVDYLVVAGGGASGYDITGSGTTFSTGGGGAGGYRTSGYGPAPLQGTALPVTATGYPITVGAGGAGGGGNAGSNSIFSTITSTGGAAGGDETKSGGSGGGVQCTAATGSPKTGGSGNVPPVSPPQGNPGSPNGPTCGGAGGGAVAAGSGVNGGAGAPNLITGVACSAYAGGGAGSPNGVGGVGGGGDSGCRPTGNPGTAGGINTGGGAGGKRAAGTPAVPQSSGVFGLS
jgi:hypothetical protein